MRCSFAIPISTKELRSRGCGARESAGASTDAGHAGFFLRGARRAVSVLTWIACAVTPPYGRAEVSHPGGDASVPAGDAPRMAREAMVELPRFRGRVDYAAIFRLKAAISNCEGLT
jgi:hypothetical protein